MTTNSAEEGRTRGTTWKRRAARLLLPAVAALGLPLIAATPAGAVPVTAGSCAPVYTTSIADYRFGGTFTSEVSGPTAGATIYLGAHGASGLTSTVRLQLLENGLPGDTVAQGSVRQDQLTASAAATFVPFTSPVDLEGGTTYVLTFDVPRGQHPWVFSYAGSPCSGFLSYGTGSGWNNWGAAPAFSVEVDADRAPNPKELRWSGQGGTVGSTDPNTVVSLDDRQTWAPAYVLNAHPWDNAWYDKTDDRALWINCGPTYGHCLDRGAWYRTFLVMPEEGPYSLKFNVVADNYATAYMNGVAVSPRFEQAGSITIPPSVLHAGVNVFEMYVEDVGGLAGFKYDVYGTFDTGAVVDEDGDGEVDVTNTAPAIADNDDLTVEATSAAGAEVTFDVPAVTDAEQADLAATCDAPSGTFGLGTHTVTCTVTDAGGLTDESSFTITVQDTVAPAISFSGNAGTYGVDEQVAISCSATDAVTAGLTCAGASGPAHGFGLGGETLTRTVADAAGNEGSGTTSFEVVVTGTNLCSLTTKLVPEKGITNSLCVKLRAGSYGAYRNELRAQSGKKVPASAASLLSQLSLALG